MDVWDNLIWIVQDFADPRKRVFVGYLFLSLIIAFVWIWWVGRKTPDTTGRSSLRRLFDKRIFFSNSAKADYKIFVLNRLFSGFISPLLLTQVGIATGMFYLLHDQDWIRSGALGGTPKTVVVALFSLTMFVVDDFTKYLLHRWMHRWPALWSLHKVHHSATTMTPITVYRVHPLEGVLYGARGAVAQGSTIGLFIFLFGNTVDLYTVVGVNVLVFAFHVTGSNLRHSHVDIHYWPWLERILISPAQHQLHHSVAEEHHDKNFGAALAVWDWLFGSLHLSEREKNLTFGLEGRDADYEADLGTIYFRPFREIGRFFKRRATRLWHTVPKRSSPTAPRKDA